MTKEGVVVGAFRKKIENAPFKSSVPIVLSMSLITVDWFSGKFIQ
jgi:uncharacterized membrane protein YsdA (DUF1294 family)